MTLAHQTSLSTLADHDWNALSSRWSRGIDWTVEKIGRKWAIMGRLGQGFHHFTTKKAAYEAATNLVLAEASYRAAKRNNLPTYN